MPEFTWPIQHVEYDTSDATPVITTLVTAATQGDGAMLPEVSCLGITTDGVVGVSFLGGYAVSRSGVGLLQSTLFSLSDTFGTGLPIPTVTVSGNDLILTTTGLAATDVRWLAHWTLVDFPLP